MPASQIKKIQKSSNFSIGLKRFLGNKIEKDIRVENNIYVVQ